MAIGTTIIILVLVAVLIYALIEIQRFKHKLFAFFLIGLLIFGYISTTIVFKDQNIDIKSIDGLKKGFKLYFSWLGSVFGNIKSITADAVKMDWSYKNQTNPE